MSDDKAVYWAAEADSEELVSRFFNEVRHGYLRQMKKSGRYDRIVRAFNTYRGYGVDGGGDTSALGAAGDRGELIDVTTNDFAQLIQQGHVLLTQAPPAFKAVAANTDYRSRLNAELGDVLCEYYESEGSMSEVETEAGKAALLAAESHVVLAWDKRAGREVSADVDAGEVIHEGDACFRMLPSWDVVYDLTCGGPSGQQWFAFRIRVNRWDLAASHPDCAEALQSDHEESDQWEFPWRKRQSELPRSDFVWMWEVRHLRTPALKNGRLVRFVSPECILFDSVKAVGAPAQHLEMYPEQALAAEGVKQLADFGYPYGAELECFSLTPERLIGEMEPHTSYFDLLSLQDGIDASMSAMASAANAGGLSNWQVAPGSNVDVTDMGGGLKLIESSAEIKLIPSAKVDEGAVRFGEVCLEFMRRRVGFNDASLGDVTKGMPAQMAALLQAQAVQFHSQLQRGYYVLQAKVRTGLLRLLRRFANTPRVAAITGKSRTYQLREFQASDLEGVERVTFQPLNPVMRTQAGRESYADKMLDRQMITKRQYETLILTGRMDSDEMESDNDRVQRDKEILREGRGLPPVQMIGADPALTEDGEPRLSGGEPGKQYIRPLLIDTHWSDIRSLREVLAMPDARQDAAVVKATLEVINLKLDMMRQMDPLLIVLLGGPIEQLMPFLVNAPMVPSGPGAPAGSPGSPAGGPPLPSPAGKTAVPNGGPQIRDVKQPKPPPNPLTGEKPPAPLA